MTLSVVVFLLSLAHAKDFSERRSPYECGQCCSGFAVCADLSTSENRNACLKLLPKGCQLTFTDHISVKVGRSEVCPALRNQQIASGYARDHYEVSEAVASDYVTFSTSDLVHFTQWGRFASHLIISNVLWTSQDGCSYSMIAYPTPADFPAVCSSPTIDTTTKDVADVDLSPLTSGSGFKVHLNSKLPLTDVDYVSLKARGDSCTPFTVQAPPTINATIPITVTTTGEAVAEANFTAISTDRRIDLTASDDSSSPSTLQAQPTLTVTVPSTASGISGSSVGNDNTATNIRADITASADSSGPSTVTIADTPTLETSPTPSTVSGLNIRASRDSFAPLTEQALTTSIAGSNGGEVVSVTRRNAFAPMVRHKRNSAASCVAPALFLTLFVSLNI